MSTSKSPFRVSRTFAQTQILSTEVAYVVSRFPPVGKWKELKRKETSSSMTRPERDSEYHGGHHAARFLRPPANPSKLYDPHEGLRAPCLYWLMVVNNPSCLSVWICPKIGHPKANACIISFPKKRPDIGECWGSLLQFQTNRSGFQPKRGSCRWFLRFRIYPRQVLPAWKHDLGIRNPCGNEVSQQRSSSNVHLAFRKSKADIWSNMCLCSCSLCKQKAA